MPTLTPKPSSTSTPPCQHSTPGRSPRHPSPRTPARTRPRATSTLPSSCSATSRATPRWAAPPSGAVPPVCQLGICSPCLHAALRRRIGLLGAHQVPRPASSIRAPPPCSRPRRRRCESGCTCKPRYADGMNDLPESTAYFVQLHATPSRNCSLVVVNAAPSDARCATRAEGGGGRKAGPRTWGEGGKSCRQGRRPADPRSAPSLPVPRRTAGTPSSR
jgi:hypothetical protein